jgi:hypothetical protein
MSERRKAGLSVEEEQDEPKMSTETMLKKLTPNP